MQDDNQEKKLGDLLRNHQEDHPMPYEEGTWEAFDRLRKPKSIPFWYWAGGIAASLLLFWLVGSLIWSETDQAGGDSTQLSESIQESQNPAIAESQTTVETETATESEDLKSPEKSHLGVNRTKSSASQKEDLSMSMSKEALATNSPKEKSEDSPAITSSSDQSAVKSAQETSMDETNAVAVISEEKNASESTLVPQTYLTEEEAKAKLMVQVGEETSLVEEIQKESVRTLALGFGPGFGSSGGDEPTSGSSFNLGVLMGIELGQKVTLSSGLGVNYLNQASQSQRYAQAAGFASAVRETQEIRQVQVDIPLYVTYPVTAGGSVSVQAGFSNLIAFNQSAQMESNFTRQVAVADMESAFSNTLKLQSTAVSQVSELPVPNQRFYPFATANLGVNIRIFERKNTSYAIMPFYNYPIQEISGYGEKLGFYGASFKILFGTTDKK
ncbi:MAG: hypothetical protein B7Z16_11170 [Algoriphagus sp. 32-45-6]|nr:MAG: hypothetical protein B7Z16_11170 [Algoriphagus sp. 32-45-6]